MPRPRPSLPRGRRRQRRPDRWDENSSSPTYNQFVHRTWGASGPGGNSTGSGHTEVHILDAAHPRAFLLHAATALPETDLATWSYATGDDDRDGQADLYAINTQDAGSHSTAVHVLNGRDVGQYLLHAGTPLASTSLTSWPFDVP